MLKHTLVLASSSNYRKALLEQLHMPFDAFSPNVDEKPLKNESAESLATRLAQQKAQAILNIETSIEHWVIGSDQTLCIEGEILGKPHTPEKAFEQLSLCSGKRVRFYTGLSLFNSQSRQHLSTCETFDVQFRALSAQQIHHYIEKEPALDCAGSFKMEGLGITLFKSLSGRDPNSLVGLPLIALCDLLEQAGLFPLDC